MRSEPADIAVKHVSSSWWFFWESSQLLVSMDTPTVWVDILFTIRSNPILLGFIH